MSIHTQQIQQIDGGFAKGIDEGALRMVLDNMQKTQYSHPYKSTIRELASNGIDAVRERDLALAILCGKTTVEEHYVKLEGPEYKDSYFDHMYYDPQWLSDDPNVYITYQDGTQIEKDKLIIRDYGVGLWGKRLEGYFQIAYSTKRLSKYGLGKFGIGAKAALSTGVPFYTVINRYNGRETSFNIYSYQVEPVTAKWNMVTGKENPSFQMSNGAVCYYTHTLEKNGLEIVLETKKHHKQEYIDAVKSQLLYFDNVVFLVVAANGVVDRVDVAAKILYEDDIMILSENKMYSKPHILINKVNYGNINFQELDLEDKMGNISIKFKPEEVSLKPSREDVIWDETTRANIIKRFREVQTVSENLLQKELNETDFMKWLRACILIKNMLGTEQSNTLVARLSKLVDLKGYTPIYKPDPQFRLNKDLFAGMKARKTWYKSERVGSKHETKVARTDVSLSDLVNDDLPVLIQRTDTSWMRDRYLLDTLFPDGFITLWLNETEIQKPPVTEDVPEELVEQIYAGRKAALFLHAKDTAFELKLLKGLEEHSREEEVTAVEQVLHRWTKLNEYILASDGLRHYEDFEVPESYKSSGKVEDSEESTVKKEDEVQTQEARISAEQRRKLSGKTILFTPRVRASLGYGDHIKDLYEWDKQEIPTVQIDEWDNEEVFYSSDDSASLLQLAAFITRPHENVLWSRSYTKEETVWDSYQASMAPRYTIEEKEYVTKLTAYDGAPVRLIKVAKDRVKYYQDFKHIHQFFAQVTKNKTITMSNALIRWNTARYIHQHLPELRFLYNFKVFNEEMHNLYNIVKNYSEEHYRSVGDYIGKFKHLDQVEYEDMVRHIDKVTELQVFVHEHRDDTEAIAKMVKELFGIGLENTVTDGCGIDINIRGIVHKLLDYAEPVKTLLNEVSVLTSSELECIITEDLEREIRNYIQFKQADL